MSSRLAAQVHAELSEHLIADTLQNAVASFDGFGRETCRVNAAKASDPAKAEKISFQNPSGARTNVQQLFGEDFTQNIDPADWEFINRCAQKRHLLAHNMGVVDKHYLTKTGDRTATEGRKVQIAADEVNRIRPTARARLRLPRQIRSTTIAARPHDALRHRRSYRPSPLVAGMELLRKEAEFDVTGRCTCRLLFILIPNPVDRRMQQTLLGVNRNGPFRRGECSAIAAF